MLNTEAYQILGIPRTATKDEIKAAYRRKAHEHHPDKGGSTAKFKEVQQAYNLIKDMPAQQVDPEFNYQGGGSTWQNPFPEGNTIWEMYNRKKEEEANAREKWRRMYMNDDAGQEPRMTPGEVFTELNRRRHAEQVRHERAMNEINEWYSNAIKKAKL